MTIGLRDESQWTIADLYAAAEPLLDAAEQLAPGPELATACVALQSEPMGAAGSVRLAVLWERLVSWVTAQQMRAQVDALESSVCPHSSGDAELLTVVELATATRVAESTVSRRVDLALQVHQRLPLCWEALNAGTLTTSHVRALADTLHNVDPDVARAIEAHVLPGALRGLRPQQLRNAARKALLVLDRDAAAQRLAAARADADVRYRPCDDGVASINAVGDAVLLRMVQDAVDGEADRLAKAGDDRRLGLLRVDALARLVLGEQTDKPQVEVVVTMDLATALRLRSNPADLAGVGPIDSDLASILACDAGWRRLVTDPITGTPLDLGLSCYRPSAALRRFIATRDRTCQFPGCPRRAKRCDLDHRCPYDDGGPTSAENLHALCRRHHNLKTRRLWSVVLDDDSGQTWTSNLTGRRHRVPPPWDEDPAPDPSPRTTTPDPPWLDVEGEDRAFQLDPEPPPDDDEVEIEDMARDSIGFATEDPGWGTRLDDAYQRYVNRPVLDDPDHPRVRLEQLLAG